MKTFESGKTNHVLIIKRHRHTDSKKPIVPLPSKKLQVSKLLNTIDLQWNLNTTTPDKTKLLVMNLMSGSLDFPYEIILSIKQTSI